MIDQSIYKVFKRDKKVIIPDFGAFIHSEITDTADFNDLLNFDDGKIIAEIQKQQKLSEEEARNDLSEYVQGITKTLNQGIQHFFEGIGYLAQDPQGSYSIHKTESYADSINEEEVQEPAETDIIERQEQADDKAEISDYDQSEKPHLEHFNMETSSIQRKVDMELELVDDEDTLTIPTEEKRHTDIDSAYSYKPILSEEDENVQEYYQRKEKFYDETKKRSPFITAMMVAIPIILIGFAGYYYFNYYIPQDVQNTDDLQLSQLIPSLFVETPTVNNTEEVRVEEVVNEKKNKNESSSSNTNTDVSKSSKQPKPTASKSSASTPTTREAPRGQNITYSLILGSFKQENNADRLQQRLQEKGFEVDKFQRGNSLYFVGYEHIDGKSNALRLLTKIKEEESSAWITKKY